MKLLKIIKYFIKELPIYLFSRPQNITYLAAQTIDKDDVKLAKLWLKNRSNWHNLDVINQYETEFARWNGSKYAFAFGGGRVALSACIHALGLKAGDEVIIPGYTCIVVFNAFRYANIKPVFSDIELETYGLDFNQLKNNTTKNTKAILIQHLYGLVCKDYEKIINFANDRKIRIIEDCAHAAGAEYKGLKLGNRGDVSFYSSNRAKVFSTVEGGIAVTNDNKLGQKLKEYYRKASYPDDTLINKLLHNVLLDYYSYRHPRREFLRGLIYKLYGSMHHYSTSEDEQKGKCPSNYVTKISAPLAALGINQLRKIDYYNSKRRETAKLWDNWCEKHGYKKPLIIEDSTPVFTRYPVLVESSKKIDTTWAIEELNLELGVWFISNQHPVDAVVEGCPNADIAVKRCVNLPGIHLDT